MQCFPHTLLGVAFSPVMLSARDQANNRKLQHAQSAGHGPCPEPQAVESSPVQSEEVRQAVLRLESRDATLCSARQPRRLWRTLGRSIKGS